MNDIYCHPLDRPERAMAGLYPLLTIVHGAAAFGAAILLAVPIVTIVLLVLQSYQALVFHILPIFIFSIPAALLSYFTYGSAIVHLNRAACSILTVIFGLLLVLQITTFGRVLLRHSDPTSVLLGAIAYVGAAWVGCSVMSGLFRLARLTDQDSGLLRAPFDGMANKMALQYFCGLPPIIRFVRGVKAKLLILSSSVFFSLAFTNWPFYLIEVGNHANPAAQLAILAGALIATLLPLAAANWLLYRGQRSIRFSIEAITAVDPRSPILFLRAFRDDQVALLSPHYTPLGRVLAIAMARQSLDDMLLTEGTLYGPVVALGNPNDGMPPYGAARGYVANEHWQNAVTQLARSALAVVISVDDTDSIWWEIEHLVGHDHLDKTLFLIHPRFRSQSENGRIVGRILATLSMSPQLERRMTDAFQTADVVGFFFDRNGDLCVGKSSLFTSFSYLLMTRWFLRHKFGFGVAMDAGRGAVSRRAA